ncbi:MAG TPA: sulfite exporter TauE/SafE family protein [Prolixibacteraceae bacterium]
MRIFSKQKTFGSINYQFMTALFIVLFVGAIFAGFLGSLTGLGGGVVLVPLLTIGFGIDIRYAIGTSLIAVIATSSGAASAFLKDGLLNIRIGMFLEIATTLGAVAGAAIAYFAPTHIIAIIFGFVLLYSAVVSFRKSKEADDLHDQDKVKYGRFAHLLKARGTFVDKTGGEINYKLQHVGGGFAVMMVAGILSGLLGIGSGALKVIAMDSIMKIPFKVSTATSNFMIGVTAAASAGIYFSRGYIDPVLSMPIMIGVLSGSLLGARILLKSQTKSIRVIFAVVIVFLAMEMIYNGIVKSI